MSECTINVIKVLHDTTVDGPGFRTSIYCAGCAHECVGCHNPQSWNFGAGEVRTIDSLLEEVMADPFADVTFSGGDPLYQADAFALLARRIKEVSHKNIWCYTGFRYDQLLHSESARCLLSYVDVLVDGPFVQSLRDADALFRGSANQRLIDIPQSLAKGEVVLWERNWK